MSVRGTFFILGAAWEMAANGELLRYTKSQVAGRRAVLQASHEKENTATVGLTCEDARRCVVRRAVHWNA